MIRTTATSAADQRTGAVAAERLLPTRGVVFGVVAACTYAVGPVLMKAALDSMTVWTLLIWRLLVASALLWAVLSLRRDLRDRPLARVGDRVRRRRPRDRRARGADRSASACRAPA